MIEPKDVVFGADVVGDWGEGGAWYGKIKSIGVSYATADLRRLPEKEGRINIANNHIIAISPGAGDLKNYSLGKIPLRFRKKAKDIKSWQLK